MNHKTEIRKQYEDFISILENTRVGIGQIRGEYKKFKDIQTSVLAVIESQIDASKNQMRKVMEGTVWDELVIAFFGVTNAGKSTIIETFRAMFEEEERKQQIKENEGRGVDGIIVGDGYSDFTKVYHEYHLRINGKPFILIDVPGIEGNEEEFKDEILNALKQAHCVFFVHGENKGIEAPIVEKIVTYLSDWVEVYSIYNARGATSDYDLEEGLLMDDDRETEQAIETTFRASLGNLYKGNVTVQALLALCAVANFHASKTQLLASQRWAFDRIGSKEAILDFSQFGKLVSLVDEKAGSFSSIILQANRLKLAGLKTRIERRLADCKTQSQPKIESITAQLRSFSNSVDKAFDQASSDIKKGLTHEAEQTMADIRKKAFGVIDRGGKTREMKAELKAYVEKRVNKMECKLKEILGSSRQKLADTLSVKLKDMAKSIDISIDSMLSNIKVELDWNEILSCLDFKLLKDGVLKALTTFLSASAFVGGCAWAGAKIGTLASGGNPAGTAAGTTIGAIVGGALYAGKVILTPGGSKAKAKQEVAKHLDEEKEKLLRQIRTASMNAGRMLDSVQTPIKQSIDQEIENVGKLDKRLNDLLLKFTVK